jgi:hypothetical protein
MAAGAAVTLQASFFTGTAASSGVTITVVADTLPTVVGFVSTATVSELLSGITTFAAVVVLVVAPVSTVSWSIGGAVGATGTAVVRAVAANAACSNAAKRRFPDGGSII